MLTVQYCDVHVHNRCTTGEGRGYRWNIVERAISRPATRPSIIGDRISSRFSEFACCKFDIAPTSFSLTLSLSSRLALSLEGWFDALINDRVDNVVHGVLPIRYRVRRYSNVLFVVDLCHWFWKIDDFIHFHAFKISNGSDLKFKSIRSLSKLCLDWHIFSGTEDGYRRFRYWTFPVRSEEGESDARVWQDLERLPFADMT